MTRVTRLRKLFEELKKYEKLVLIEAWKKIFDVEDTIDVYERLIEVKKEIISFENDLTKLQLSNSEQFKRGISVLKSIINHTNFQTTVSSFGFMKPDQYNRTKDSFEMIEAVVNTGHILLESEDTVPKDKFTNFIYSIKKTIEEIEASAMNAEDKEIFLSIFYDFNKAISLYKICGLNAFLNTIQNNICKMILIDKNIDKNEGTYYRFKLMLNSIVEEVVFWIAMYKKMEPLAKLAGRSYQYLKEMASEWVDIPKLENTTQEVEVIDDD